MHLAGRRAAGQPRLLEVGCGTGGNLALLRRHGDVVAFDAAADAVAHARAQVPSVEVAVGSFPDATPPGLGRFDAVCLFDVLEHLDDDAAAARAAGELLAAGGLLFVTVPALPWLWSRHDDAFGHRRRYLRAPLEKLLRGAGFELVHCSYFCSLLLPAIAAVRLGGRALGLSEGQDFDVPVGWLNRALHQVFAAEAAWVVRGSLPAGSSLLAVAGRPGA